MYRDTQLCNVDHVDEQSAYRKGRVRKQILAWSAVNGHPSQLSHNIITLGTERDQIRTCPPDVEKCSLIRKAAPTAVCCHQADFMQEVWHLVPTSTNIGSIPLHMDIKGTLMYQGIDSLPVFCFHMTILLSSLTCSPTVRRNSGQKQRINHRYEMNL